MKKLIFGFVIILVIAINQTASGQNVGDPAPDFTVELADGGSFTLSDHRNKVVLIYFFGNTCPLCEDSGPHVQGLYEDFMDDPDFIAVGLDTWSNSDVGLVTDFANLVGITFPLGLLANSVKLDYNFSHDRLVVVDKKGIIRRKNNTSALNDISGSSMVIQTYLEVVVAVETVTQNNTSTLYPMPVNDILHVDLYLEDDSELEMIISDITGKTRKNVNYQLGSGKQIISLNTQNLETGMYFYTIQVQDKVETGKILIQ